jgi:hypothetical protein
MKLSADSPTVCGSASSASYGVRTEFSKSITRNIEVGKVPPLTLKYEKNNRSGSGDGH